MKRRSGSFKTNEITGIVNNVRRGRIAYGRLEKYLRSKNVSLSSKANVPLDVLDFGEQNTRAQTCFRREGFTVVGDLLLISRAELRKTKNMGETTIDEIEKTLAKYDLHLGMTKKNGKQQSLDF